MIIIQEEEEINRIVILIIIIKTMNEEIKILREGNIFTNCM